MKPLTTCTNPEVGRLLAAYDAGMLAPREQAELERHLETCEACLEELHELAPHMAQLQQHPDRAARLLARPAEGAVAPSRAPRPGWRSLLARLPAPAGSAWRWAALVPVAAAVVAIVMVTGDRGAPERSLPPIRIEPLPFARVETRAAADPVLADFDAGMALYLAADYVAAAERLAGAERQLDRLLAEPGPVAPARIRQRADQAALYAGVGFLMAGRGDSARVHLRRAQASQIALCGDHARWYLAQAALRDGDRAAGAELLRLLAGGSPSYGRRAAEQLEALGIAAQ